MYFCVEKKNILKSEKEIEKIHKRKYKVFGTF